MPPERLIAWLGVPVPLLLKEPATVPRSSPVELIVTVVLFVVVGTEESAPETLEIKTPLGTLIAEPVNKTLATVPSVMAPAPSLVTVKGPPNWDKAPSVSVPRPEPLLPTSKMASPLRVEVPLRVRP